MQKKLTLDAALAKDISIAVVHSFKETFGVDVEVGMPVFGEGMVSLAGDISGIIGMVQEHLDGTLILCVNSPIVGSILPRVLGEATPITNEMIIDSVGELTNMVFGQVKSELNQRAHQIKLGIPCVITGKSHYVCQFHRGKFMVAPFFLEKRLFEVYIALHETPTNVGEEKR